MSIFEAGWGNALVKDLIATAEPAFLTFWPTTVGWQVLALLLALIVINKIYRSWLTYKRNAYRRAAMHWLEQLPDYQSLHQQPIYRQLPTILRTTAIHAFGRVRVSQLSDEHWEAWLDRQCDKSSFFTQCHGDLRLLSYAPPALFAHHQMKILLEQVCLWVRYHDVDNGSAND